MAIGRTNKLRQSATILRQSCNKLRQSLNKLRQDADKLRQSAKLRKLCNHEPGGHTDSGCEIMQGKFFSARGGHGKNTKISEKNTPAEDAIFCKAGKR